MVSMSDSAQCKRVSLGVAQFCAIDAEPPIKARMLRELAAWYRVFAARAANSAIWESRLLTADDLDAEASRSTGDRLVPYCVFTDPPLAQVGMNESEARAVNLAVRVGRLPISNVLRTEATDETQGFMKVLVGSDDRILGFAMIGSEAGEVMAAVQTAMLAELPYQRLRDAVIAHLTMAEGLGPLLANVPPH